MAATQIVHLVGKKLKNQVWNGSTAKPATLYMLLRTLNGGGNPADAANADTLTSNLAEVSGGGYSRQSITFNNTNAPETTSGNDSVLTFAQQTFAFTGTISGITHAALATTSDNTGILIESGPLGVTRNVANGDQLKVTFQSFMNQG